MLQVPTVTGSYKSNTFGKLHISVTNHEYFFFSIFLFLFVCLRFRLFLKKLNILLEQLQEINPGKDSPQNMMVI